MPIGKTRKPSRPEVPKVRFPGEKLRRVHKPRDAQAVGRNRYAVLSQCVGTLAGLDHQLGCATHLTDIENRIGWLQLHAPPDLSEDDAKTLENLRLWVGRTRQACGQFRAKLDAMRSPLCAASREIKARKGVDYGH